MKMTGKRSQHAAADASIAGWYRRDFIHPLFGGAAHEFCEASAPIEIGGGQRLSRPPVVHGGQPAKSRRSKTGSDSEVSRCPAQSTSNRCRLPLGLSKRDDCAYRRDSRELNSCPPRIWSRRKALSAKRASRCHQLRSSDQNIHYYDAITEARQIADMDLRSWLR